jgi:hypothetical protein
MGPSDVDPGGIEPPTSALQTPAIRPRSRWSQHCSMA